MYLLFSSVLGWCFIRLFCLNASNLDHHPVAKKGYQHHRVDIGNTHQQSHVHQQKWNRPIKTSPKKTHNLRTNTSESPKNSAFSPKFRPQRFDRWDCAGLSHWTPSAAGGLHRSWRSTLPRGKFGGIMLYSLVVPCEHRSGGFRMIGAPQVRDMLWMGGSTPTGAFWVYGSFFRGWVWNAHFSCSKEAHWLWHKGSEPKYWVDDTKDDHMCIQVSNMVIPW